MMANEELAVANPSSPIRVKRDDDEKERTSDESNKQNALINQKYCNISIARN